MLGPCGCASESHESAETRYRGQDIYDVLKRELDQQSQVPGLVMPFTSSVTMA